MSIGRERRGRIRGIEELEEERSRESKNKNEDDDSMEVYRACT